MEFSDSAEVIAIEQHAHPRVDAYPNAARIHKDVAVYIGNAESATDVTFLAANRIHAIISLGTGQISKKEIPSLVIDIQDMENELILLHFEKCFHFLQTHLYETENAVLVHCAYGQSRSAAVCVAYCMHIFHLSLSHAYRIVCDARPCIYINSGFLRQLALFERMKANIRGESTAHAEFRALAAANARWDTGTIDITDAILLEKYPKLTCKRCNASLGSVINKISHHSVQDSMVLCSSVYVEPLKWMNHHADLLAEKGKLYCWKSNCKAKLGSWNWNGVRCNCGRFVKPAFHLTHI